MYTFTFNLNPCLSKYWREAKDLIVDVGQVNIEYIWLLWLGFLC